ncbi:MAG: MotA/TolQ/ExbB proton channel family protein [Candidatus Babeliaceae bacterium]
MVAGNIIWSLIAQADFLSKLTLITLLCMSIVCWIVGVMKYVTLHTKSKQINDGLKRVISLYNFDELMREAQLLHGSIVGSFLAQASIKLKALVYKKTDEQIVLEERDVELLEVSLDELVAREVAEEEKYLSILSTSAEVAPLIGLFGTVWGIIHAFIRISEAQASDITVVAPGIAEALITTLAGLVVAIPALVLYHYLCKKVEAFHLHLKTIAHHFEVIAKKTFMKR